MKFGKYLGLTFGIFIALLMINSLSPTPWAGVLGNYPNVSTLAPSDKIPVILNGPNTNANINWDNFQTLASNSLNYFSNNIGIGTNSPSNASLYNNGDFITKGPWLDVRSYGTITFGTSASTPQQTANTLAIQLAVTASQTSHIPVFIPTGTILINSSIVSTLPVTIVGAGVTNTNILQTAASQYIFQLGSGVYPNFTYAYQLRNMHLASAAGSFDCVFVADVLGSTFTNINITASGRNGWWIKDSQDLTFINCNNDGRMPGITGQNTNSGGWGNRFTTTVATQAVAGDTIIALTSATGMANGQRIHFILSNGTAFRSYITNVSGNNVTIHDPIPLNLTCNVSSIVISGYGAGWLLTNATTTVTMINCNIDNPWEGVLNQSGGAFITYSGVLQGLYDWAFESDGTGSVYVNLDLYTESGSENDAGGVDLVDATFGSKVTLENGDAAGVKLVGSVGVYLTGKINTVDISSSNTNIKGENITYGFAGLGGGYFSDLSPDGEWVNVSNSNLAWMGKKDYRQLTSIFTNKGLENWNGTSIPTGLIPTSVAATITKTGVGQGDTTHFDGLYAAKLVGGGSSPTGWRVFLDPNEVNSKYVTICGKYMSAKDWAMVYTISGSSDFSSTIKASGAVWANFSVTFKVDAADTAPQFTWNVGVGNTVYIDDMNILVDNYAVALPQNLTVNSATPRVDGGNNAYIPIWKTANTSATSITNFLGGIGGQVYTFIIDINTTLVNGATMVLRGGANISGSGATTNWTSVPMLYDSESNIWVQTGYESKN